MSPQSTLDSRRYHKEKKEPRRNREGEDMNLIEDDFNYLTENLKGPWSGTPLFLFTCESLPIIFYSEHIETKGTTVELQQIIKHTFRNTTYSKAIRFRFTMQCQ